MPFLLKVESEYQKVNLVLANRIINGNLKIKKVYYPNGSTWEENYINTLGRIKVIKGRLQIEAVMLNLGDLEEIHEDFWFYNSHENQKLKTLSPLKIVFGNLILKGFNGISLGSLLEVGGNLNLRTSNIADISSLKRVGGHIYISRNQNEQIDFSSVEIGGKIKRYNNF